MSSTALNFVLDNPHGAADRIEALEAALREIITRGEDYDYPYAEEIARAALAPEPLPKTILDEPTRPPEQG